MLGGACVTEEVWPGQRVSRASYVVSMLQPKVVSDLRLARLRLRGGAARPGYATIGPDGEPIFFFNDSGRTQASIARYSRRDAAAYPRSRRCSSARPGSCVRCCCAPARARLPSGPATCSACCARPAAPPASARRDVHELFRVMTMSVGDLLDEWFETDALKGTFASTGVVGVWAGPRTPGTAYNLLHHALGELNGVRGAWGYVRGGMGGISQALARSAECRGDDPHRARTCARST